MPLRGGLARRDHHLRRRRIDSGHSPPAAENPAPATNNRLSNNKLHPSIKHKICQGYQPEGHEI